MLLVKKSLGKWRLCIDYTCFNMTCHKHLYPIKSIDKLFVNSVYYKLMSFMGAYFGYNQIPMYDSDIENIIFMIEKVNYQYNVIPVDLKNVGATY